MKVTGTGPDKTIGIAGSNSAGGVSGANDKRRPSRTPSGGVDTGVSEKVAISSKAKDAARAKDIAKSAPEADEAKIARLKSAIENGSYKIDAEAIADKLVDEHLSSMY